MLIPKSCWLRVIQSCKHPGLHLLLTHGLLSLLYHFSGVTEPQSWSPLSHQLSKPGHGTDTGDTAGPKNPTGFEQLEEELPHLATTHPTNTPDLTVPSVTEYSELGGTHNHHWVHLLSEWPIEGPWCYQHHALTMSQSQGYWLKHPFKNSRKSKSCSELSPSHCQSLKQITEFVSVFQWDTTVLFKKG